MLGFVPVERLDQLPADLKALVVVTLRDQLPELAMPVFKLVPRRIVAGIGCRRETSFQLLIELLQQQLSRYALDPLALRSIGSVSIKEDEPGLKQLSACYRVPFQVFSVDSLKEHEHRFPTSEFVRNTVGVGAVSQPVAWLMSDGHLVGDTLREQGVTITLGVSH